MSRVWPGRIVEENNLQVQVMTLRKLLGHGAIGTVPGRGYQFVAEVRAHGGKGATPPAEVNALVSVPADAPPEE